MKKILLAFVAVMLTQNLMAQTELEEAQRKLDQKKILVKERSKQLGKVIAHENINKFIITQTEALLAASDRCQATVQAIIRKKDEMNNLDGLFQGVKNAKSLMEVYQLLSFWQLKDIQYVEQFSALYQTLRLDAQKLENYLSHADLVEGQLLYLFPPDPLVFDVNAYSHDLWAYFTEYRADYRLGAKTQYEACKTFDRDVESDLRKRTENLQGIADRVAAKYIATETQAITKSIQDQFKVSDEVTYVLAARRLIGGAIEEYNKAILLRSDYYRARVWLATAEQLGVAILSMPASKWNGELKEQVRIEVNQKQSIIDQARKTIHTQPVYRWLESRYFMLEKKIQTGKLACDSVCKANLAQANRLVGAAAVLHKAGNNELFAVMAHEALDKVEGVK